MKAANLPEQAEPPSNPPFLNPTASACMSDAWYLFVNMVEKCDYSTAAWIFKKCIEQGADIEEARAKRTASAEKRAAAAPFKPPTITEIDAADRHQVCVWWERLRSTEQKFEDANVLKSIGRIQARYIEFGGYPAGYTEGKLPPIKKKGAIKRVAPNAALPALFDPTNPESAFSIERAKRGGHLTQLEFAKHLVAGGDPQFGTDAKSLLGNLRYHLGKAKK
jgi:hypothetical protein